MVGRAARSSTSGLGFSEEFAKSPTSRTERQKWAPVIGTGSCCGDNYLVADSFFASPRNAAMVAADWSLRFLFLGRRFLLVV